MPRFYAVMPKLCDLHPVLLSLGVAGVVAVPADPRAGAAIRLFVCPLGVHSSVAWIAFTLPAHIQLSTNRRDSQAISTHHHVSAVKRDEKNVSLTLHLQLVNMIPHASPPRSNPITFEHIPHSLDLATTILARMTVFPSHGDEPAPGRT